MISWKRIAEKMLFIPVWLMLLLTVISSAALVAVFVMKFEMHPAAYVIYVLSFYTLAVDSIFCSNIFPRFYRSVRKKVFDNEYGRRYFKDAAFKTRVSLYLTFGVNILYAVTNAFSGVLYGSAWFWILAAYYIILAVMRFLLLCFVNRNGIGKDRILEFRRSRLCGIILMTINLTLSGAVLMMLYQNRGYEYHGILIYVMAVYTFYVTVHAIINIIKYRKYKSPVMSAAKIISLSAALVSMLSLEMAMLSQFGMNTSPEVKRIMIAATGAGVSIIVVAMSFYMIVHSTKEINQLSGR